MTTPMVHVTKVVLRETLKGAPSALVFKRPFRALSCSQTRRSKHGLGPKHRAIRSEKKQKTLSTFLPQKVAAIMHYLVHHCAIDQRTCAHLAK